MIHEDHPDMTIGSVDGLQGQEREVNLDPLHASVCMLMVGNHIELGTIQYEW
jgi:hypothetical protein